MLFSWPFRFSEPTPALTQHIHHHPKASPNKALELLSGPAAVQVALHAQILCHARVAVHLVESLKNCSTPPHTWLSCTSLSLPVSKPTTDHFSQQTSPMRQPTPTRDINRSTKPHFTSTSSRSTGMGSEPGRPGSWKRPTLNLSRPAGPFC